MRDFRDAKAMAHTIRAALAAQGTVITVGQSLELIAKAFGQADWNTLSAAINAAAVPPQRDVPPGANIRFSPELEATLHRSIRQQSGSEHATLEHLLLALLDDKHAVAVMQAFKVDRGILRQQLSDHLDSQPRGNGVQPPTPSDAFQRVIQRAILFTQSSSDREVTGATVLLTLFSERESQAVQFLAQQNITRADVVQFMRPG